MTPGNWVSHTRTQEAIMAIAGSVGGFFQRVEEVIGIYLQKMLYAQTGKTKAAKLHLRIGIEVPMHVAAMQSALFVAAELPNGVRLVSADAMAIVAKVKAGTRICWSDSLCYFKALLLSMALPNLQPDDQFSNLPIRNILESDLGELVKKWRAWLVHLRNC